MTSTPYAGAALASRNTCFWDVELCATGERTSRSAPASWEVGLLQASDLAARFIGLRRPPYETLDYRPTPYLRRCFHLDEVPDRARLYVTAAGCHATFINGHTISPDHFRPGWTDYAKCLNLDCHDVADLLRPGQNVIASIIGEGWYAGYVGFEWRRELWGRQIGLCAQLEMQANGQRQVIATDEQWQGRYGGLLSSDMLNGEVFDHRLEPQGWLTATDGQAGWGPVIAITPPPGKLRGRVYPSVRCIQTLRPVSLSARANGDLVADFGQNIGGNVAALISGERGRIVRFQHSEALNADGSPYMDSLHSARASSTVLLDGRLCDWQPRFAHHGFRYVTISGLSDPTQLSDLRAHRLEATVPSTGHLRTSDPRLDQIVEMARRSHHSHLFEVMVDCVQRDERFGWLADPVSFLPSAFYLSDMEPFLEKWLENIRDAQHPDGVIPRMAPEYKAHPSQYGAGWGSDVFEGLAGGFSDAFVRLVWQMYLFTGDKVRLYQDLPRVRALIERLLQETKDGIWEAKQSTIIGADHIEDPPQTPASFVATALLCHSLDLARQMAAICGEKELERTWLKVAQVLRDAFQRRFLGPDGNLTIQTQSALTLATAYDLLPTDLAQRARQHLIAVISNDERLRTGIFTTPLVLAELSRGGRSDLAYLVLQSDAMRTFGFWAKHGLTTIPERWDALDGEGWPIREPANSLSHVALGSVVEWIFAQAGGLTPASPGWHRIRFAPGLTDTLDWAECRIWTPSGPLEARWKRNEGKIEAELDIPPNCSCEIVSAGSVQELRNGSFRLVCPVGENQVWTTT
jgi:alpha-L-rhamnosidase